MPLAVLFDLDGTLVDRASTLEEFLPLFARRCCSNPVEQEADFIARFHELDAGGYGDKSILFTTLCCEFVLTAGPEELQDDFRSRCWQEARLFAGVEKMLERLRAAGFHLALVSNGSSVSQRSKIRAAGLEEWFDAVLISSEQRVSKPEPGIFERAARKLGVDTSDCLFIGDHPEKDVVGAARVGMTTVWVSHGDSWPAGLEVEPTFMVAGVTEVGPLMGRQPEKTDSAGP